MGEVVLYLNSLNLETKDINILCRQNGEFYELPRIKWLNNGPENPVDKGRELLNSLIGEGSDWISIRLSALRFNDNKVMAYYSAFIPYNKEGYNNYIFLPFFEIFNKKFIYKELDNLS